jgi:hypothetical protein
MEAGRLIQNSRQAQPKGVLMNGQTNTADQAQSHAQCDQQGNTNIRTVGPEYQQNSRGNN